MLYNGEESKGQPSKEAGRSVFDQAALPTVVGVGQRYAEELALLTECKRCRRNLSF